eukprot:CAMPEP_0176255474 /NCGR_PEP_ID=MMETSP0121_2-20121125/37059_1 /TAXON_ID=160619 /ORGANISM="Kryptoperidinium foliaceum, Strain CCMP 1326" /LENGTH=86 /DNA_ID=CAMNT_0017595301 /DNA_START=388 /DNA_END=645 /DNA_ORIENTATION=+
MSTKTAMAAAEPEAPRYRDGLARSWLRRAAGKILAAGPEEFLDVQCHAEPQRVQFFSLMRGIDRCGPHGAVVASLVHQSVHTEEGA